MPCMRTRAVEWWRMRKATTLFSVTKTSDKQDHGVYYHGREEAVRIDSVAWAMVGWSLLHFIPQSLMHGGSRLIILTRLFRSPWAFKRKACEFNKLGTLAKKVVIYWRASLEISRIVCAHTCDEEMCR